MALPALTDPNFERAVVLVLEHDEDGALGVVLNRPTRTPGEAVIDGWEDVAASPSVLFDGGPVEPEAVVGLAVALPDAEPPGAVTARITMVDLTTTPDRLAVEVEAARLFAGYAGWAPGQLEDEIGDGAWTIVDVVDEDVVADDPVGLWRCVLARQPGSLRLLASFPDDPALN